MHSGKRAVHYLGVDLCFLATDRTIKGSVTIYEGIKQLNKAWEECKKPKR